MSNNKFFIIAGILIAASVGFWVWMFQAPDSTEATVAADTPTFYQPTVAEDSGERFEGDVTLTMYRTEGCECCVKWADYLEADGMDVTTETVNDMFPMKEELGIPRELRSCHTAMVDGYVVEGHVPIEDIRRLLAERPDVIGISAPGMPPNSPGMDLDVENEWQTVLFDRENMTVYNTHN
jgi:hypothetical protein